MLSTPVRATRVAEVYAAQTTYLHEFEILPAVAFTGKLTQGRRGESSWKKLVSQLLHPFALLLWLAGGIAFLVNQPASGFTIWLLVLVNAGLSFWRDNRTEQAMRTLRSLLPIYSRVVREGVETSVLASEIVPGDVIVLAEGDNIPADARVVEAFGLRTNHSTLTGEAVPALRTSDASNVKAQKIGKG
jgi:magnesium-transporting ATPase (P-type)